MATVTAAVAVAEAVAVAVGGRGTVRSAVSPPIRAPSSLRAAVLSCGCGWFSQDPPTPLIEKPQARSRRLEFAPLGPSHRLSISAEILGETKL